VEFAQEEDLYAVLGVTPEANDSEIRKAYKKLAVTLHPDKFIDREPGVREEAQQKFAKVSYAYNVLKDPEQRNEYDFMRRMAAGADDPGPPVDQGPVLSDEELAERREMAEKRFRQGIAYQMDKNIKGALDSFKEAVRIDPSVAQYHTMLAVTYQKMGWVSYAMAEIHAALKIEPKDPLAIKIRGQLRQMEKQLEAEEEARLAKDKKGKKKRKKGDESEAVTIKGRRKAAAKAAIAKQVQFKKKRQGFLESLFGGLFKRK
jgi:curved DNA-binding protein CbpA